MTQENYSEVQQSYDTDNVSYKVFGNEETK
mgnify:CR=1 FL=1